MCEIYSLNIDYYIVESKKFNITFSVNDSKNEILDKLKGLNYKIEIRKDSCINYVYEGIEISFLGEKVNSIDLITSEFSTKSNIHIGDKIKQVYQEYNLPDYQGKFDDGVLFVDYYADLETNSPWKKPRYVMRIVYLKEIINEILFFYTE